MVTAIDSASSVTIQEFEIKAAVARSMALSQRRSVVFDLAISTTAASFAPLKRGEAFAASSSI